jgi:hypothetical protein
MSVSAWALIEFVLVVSIAMGVVTRYYPPWADRSVKWSAERVEAVTLLWVRWTPFVLAFLVVPILVSHHGWRGWAPVGVICVYLSGRAGTELGLRLRNRKESKS